MQDLGNHASALSKAAGNVAGYQKLRHGIATSQAAMLAVRNQARQLAPQLKASRAQTAALAEQYALANTEFLKTDASLSQNRTSYEAATRQVKALSAQMKANPSAELREKLDAAQVAAQNLKDTVAQNREQFKGASVRAKELKKQLKDATAQEKAMSKESQTLNSRADVLQKGLDKDRTALGKLRLALVGAGVDMKSLASEQNRLIAESEKYANSQKRIKEATFAYEAGKHQLSWGNIKGDVMTSAGLLMALKAPVSTAMNFEQAMSGVNAIMFSGGKRTDEQKTADAAALAELRAQALKLGSETQFTAMQAANSQENLARAGFKKDEILAAMPGLLNMAAAEGMDLAGAADIAASALRGFNLDAEDSNRVADVLAKTSLMSNTNIVGLGEAMKYAAPMAAGLGVSIEQTSALLAAMANAGIKGSQAGTALRATFTRLSKEPKETEKALLALGVASRTADGKMRTLPSLMEELSKKTKNMGEATKTKHFTNIFGTDAASAMIAVMNAVEKGDIASFEEALKKENVTGTAKEVAEARNDNLAGDLTKLSSAWEGISETVGSVFIPVLRSGVQLLTDGISKVTGLARTFPNLTKVIVGGLGGVAAFKVIRTVCGISKVLMKMPFLYGKVISAVMAARKVQGQLSIAQMVWNKVMSAGRGLLNVGRLVLYHGKQLAIAVATKAWTAAQGAWNLAMSAGRGLLNVGQLVLYHGKQLAIAVATKAWTAAQWLWNAAMNANPIGLIVAGIAGLIAAGYWLYQNWDSVCAGIVATWNWLWDTIKSFWDWLSGLFSWEGLTAGFDGACALISSGWEGLKKSFVQPFAVAWDWLTSGWENARGIISSGWDALKNGFSNVAGVAWDWLASGWESAKGIISGGWDAVKNSFLGGWMSDVWSGFTSAAAGAWETIKSGWSTVSGLINDGLSKAGSIFSDAWSWMKDLVGMGDDPAVADQAVLMAQLNDITVLNKMSGDFAARVQEMTDAWQPFKDSLGGGFEAILNIMTLIGSQIQNTVIPAVSALTASLSEMAAGVQAVAMAGGIEVSLPKAAAPSVAANPFGSSVGQYDPFYAHAAGGIFSTPHLGLVAESGAEAIIPLENRSRGMPLWMAAGESMGVKFGSTTTQNNITTGAPNVNITIYGGEPDLAQRVKQAVQDALREIQDYNTRVSLA